jgi:AAHS family 4-hydroxybenzoate transporter-like MFS transporter
MSSQNELAQGSGLVIDVGQVVDEQKFQWFNLRLVLLCWLVIFCDGYDIFAITYVGPAIARQWHLSPTALGPIFSSSMFAYLFSVPLASYLSDKIGRKPIMIACLLIICLSSFGSMFATGVASLFAMRMMTGIGLGAVTPPTITHCAEFAPKRIRGRLVLLMYTGINFGGLAVGLVAAVLLSQFGWRSIFFLGAFIPGIALVLVAFFLPESVKFLVLHDRQPALVGRLVRIMRPGQKITGESRFTMASEPKKLPFRLTLLFNDKFGWITFSIWMIFIFSYMGVFFVQSWLNFVLRASGMPQTEAALSSSMLALGGIFGGVILSGFIDRFGMLAVAAFCVLFGAASAAIGFAVGASVALTVIIACVGFSGQAVLFGMNAVTSSIYPTSFRTSALGSALLVSRIGAILGPIVGGYLISMKLPLHVVFLFPIIPAAVCFVFSAVLSRLFYKRFRSLGIPELKAHEMGSRSGTEGKAVKSVLQDGETIPLPPHI